ncbi:hypothetical protein [Mesonia sp. K4-1]|uniref:hypothetical protein n=1 Tax=Mesonia sp. K4-1 TaxID=2602760 RepID=UPI0011CAAC37|nr:hypothetical protein [Mesonia sp. K4-1]TXK78910.1 hypothetical protein FT986_03680 [Mesonia sp. K4-1]
MKANHPKKEGKKQLTLRIPVEILAEAELSLNEKYLLGIDFNLLEKEGYNCYTNKAIGQTLQLHPNLVSKARKQLVNKGFLHREGRKYYLSDLAQNYLDQNDMMAYIYPWVYQNEQLSTGAKLLYGEYNSISRSQRNYFASRQYSADKLNVSVESITNWTKQLYQEGCLDCYYHNRGYYRNQKVVRTSGFPNLKFLD